MMYEVLGQDAKTGDEASLASLFYKMPERSLALLYRV